MSKYKYTHALLLFVSSWLIISLCLSTVFAAPKDEAVPGKEINVVYYEEFNYDDVVGNASVANLLGWKQLSKSEGTAPGNCTMILSVVDGRLFVNNHQNINGTDSYMMILDESKTTDFAENDYTLQYDVMLTSSGNDQRYIVILTDYALSSQGEYNSFHLRINGSGNNQSRIGGTWYTYDVEGDFYAADSNDGDGTSTILKKITGNDYTGGALLKDLDLTIRYVCRADAAGPYVYMRNNTAGGDFVLVSEPSSESTASQFWRTDMMPGRAIVLKAGGQIDGYVDNILIYTGSEEPVFEVETTEAPEDTESPDDTETTDDDDSEGSWDYGKGFFAAISSGKWAGWILFAVIVATSVTVTVYKVRRTEKKVIEKKKSKK